MTTKTQAQTRRQPDLIQGPSWASYTATETLFLENAADRQAFRFWARFVDKAPAEIERATKDGTGHGVFFESAQRVSRHRLVRLIKQNGFLYGELALEDQETARP